MSAEGRRWLTYAQENLRAATLCLESDLFNPCLQNAQQAVEKALKAIDWTKHDLLAHNNNRPFGRFVDGAQFHILSYLGEWWGGGQPRFPDSLAVSYTDYVTSHDGVVTWDIPVRGDGDIPEDYLRQLKKIGAKCRETAASPSG